jgi:hypothetical protein
MRVLFDTDEYVTTLKEGGVPDNQAHAMSRGLHHAFRQGVATSEDITKLEARMTVLEGKIDNVAATLEGKIDNVAATLEGKIDNVAATLEGKIDSVAVVQGAKTENVRITLDAKIDGVEKNLNIKIDSAVTMLKDRMQMQMYVLLAVIAITSHLGYHILQIIGLVH